MKLSLLISLTLTLISGAALAETNTLDLYVYPPRHPLDWSNPRKTLNSFLKNYASGMVGESFPVKGVDDFGDAYEIKSNYQSSMGHTIGHISCSLPNGERFERWSSFSGQDFREVDKQLAFKEKRGMGVLFHDFVDGHIISGEENIRRLTYLKGRKVKNAEGKSVREMPRYMRMHIGPEKCAELKNMITFFESFHFKKGTKLEELLKRPVNKTLYFTNNMDPYESYTARLSDENAPVGGGCAPYGVAMMKMSGHFSPELEEIFKLKVSVSEGLIGNGVDRKIKISSILLGSLGSSWSVDGYEDRPFNQYDPQLIWDFIGSVRACLGVKDYKDSSCTSEAKNWIENNGFQESIGRDQKFSHSMRVKKIENDGDGNRMITEELKTENIIRGIELNSL